MPYARSGELSIHYRRPGDRGQSPNRDRALTPILVVHGLSYFSWDWIPVGEALAKRREVLLMDMRGFGDSDWSADKDYAVPSMAKDILAVLDEAGVGRAVLVGHSMGGRSAAYAAARFPERIAALVLVDYTPENAPAGSRRVTERVAGVPEKFASIEEAMAHFGSSNRARLEAYLKPVDGGFVLKRDRHFQDQFKKALATGERPKLGVDMWGVIGEVRCPILSVRGARSDLYAPQTVEKMRAANPRLEVVEVDAGHDVAGDNSKDLLQVLEKFLDEKEL